MASSGQRRSHSVDAARRPGPVQPVGGAPDRVALRHVRHRRSRRPRGVAWKPAFARASASGWPDPSTGPAVGLLDGERPSAPSRTARASASAALCSSGWGRRSRTAGSCRPARRRGRARRRPAPPARRPCGPAGVPSGRCPGSLVVPSARRRGPARAGPRRRRWPGRWRRAPAPAPGARPASAPRWGGRRRGAGRRRRCVGELRGAERLDEVAAAHPAGLLGGGQHAVDAGEPARHLLGHDRAPGHHAVAVEEHLGGGVGAHGGVALDLGQQRPAPGTGGWTAAGRQRRAGPGPAGPTGRPSDPRRPA